MRYVVAGYVVIVVALCLYSAQLVWRRRRLRRAVARVTAGPDAAPATVPAGGTS
jgi:hypothetical protein